MPRPTAIPSLAGAPWLTRPETRAVLRALRAAGHEARVVGGAVRNALIGKPVADIDIATPATPDQVVQAAVASGLLVIPTGLQHGTVTVVSDCVPHEVTTLRHDVETDGRHATVAFTQDWAADAARRDFTINALYCDADGVVHDPLGGYPDLAARRVRFIGSADQRIAEDYLRILRFFRFYAEYAGGPPDPEGLAACVRGRAGLATLSAERIRAELLKLLVAPEAVSAIAAMYDHALLVPILASVPRLPQFVRLTAIEAALSIAADPIRRLGCLAIHVHEDAGRLGRRLRLSNEETAGLKRLAGSSASRMSARLEDADAKPLLYRMGVCAWRDAAIVQWAWSAAPDTDAAWLRLARLPDLWPVPVFPVKGGDLIALGWPPGPQLGETLRRLEEDWIAGGFVGSRDSLLALARRRLPPV